MNFMKCRQCEIWMNDGQCPRCGHPNGYLGNTNEAMTTDETPTPLTDAAKDIVLEAFNLWGESKIFTSDLADVIRAEFGKLRDLERRNAELVAALESLVKRIDIDDPDNEWIQDDWQGCVDSARAIALGALTCQQGNHE